MGTAVAAFCDPQPQCISPKTSGKLASQAFCSLVYRPSKHSLSDLRQGTAPHAIRTRHPGQLSCFTNSSRNIVLPAMWIKERRAHCTARDQRSHMEAIFSKLMKHHGRSL